MLMSHLQQSISHADIPTKVGHVIGSFIYLVTWCSCYLKSSSFC